MLNGTDDEPKRVLSAREYELVAWLWTVLELEGKLANIEYWMKRLHMRHDRHLAASHALLSLRDILAQEREELRLE